MQLCIRNCAHKRKCFLLFVSSICIFFIFGIIFTHTFNDAVVEMHEDIDETINIYLRFTNFVLLHIKSFFQLFFRSLSQDRPISRDCIFWNETHHPDHKFKLPRTENNVSFGNGENDQHRKQSFERIYDTNGWGRSKSGPGSFLNSTINMRLALGNVVDRIKVHLQKNKIRYRMLLNLV